MRRGACNEIQAENHVASKRLRRFVARTDTHPFGATHRPIPFYTPTQRTLQFPNHLDKPWGEAATPAAAPLQFFSILFLTSIHRQTKYKAMLVIPVNSRSRHMNDSILTQLKILVERAVRPVRVSMAPKRKIREELLAHVAA